MSAAARGRTPCAYCPLRHKGLCLGVEDDDARGLAALESSRSPTQIYDAGAMIYAQGDDSEQVFNLISGWVALHRDMADGRRQITRILLPGALFGIEPPGEELSHTATAITTVTVCPIPNRKFAELRREIPTLNEQFILLLEREGHASSKTLTTLGQGSAKERIAGLFSELAIAALGEDAVSGGAVLKMPLTQRHIAEATGLTSIHVNRVLRQLREDSVVDLHDGRLTIIGADKLRAITDPGADWRWAAPLPKTASQAPREGAPPGQRAAAVSAIGRPGERRFERSGA